MKPLSNLSKKVTAVASLMSITSLLAAPLSSYALAAGTHTASTTPKTSPFCTNLSSEAGTITAKLGDLSGKVSAAWSQQDQKQTTQWQQVDKKVTADRQQADTKRKSNLTTLTTKATTDSQKQAIQTYETAVQNAVSVRRGAYDTARQTFRSSVQSAISGRRATVTIQLSTLQASVNAAISTAQSSCASDPNGGPTIRAALQTSLKSARETFRSDRKADEMVGTQVKQLAAKRDASFKATDQVFQTSLSTARQALKQAFGKSSL